MDNGCDEGGVPFLLLGEASISCGNLATAALFRQAANHGRVLLEAKPPQERRELEHEQQQQQQQP